MLHSKPGTGGEYHRELPRDRESGETLTFKPPRYQIFYASDQTLQWDPPADSRELAEALSYHFPIEKSLKSKMQAATRVFLQNRKRSKSIGEAAQPLVPRDVSKNRDPTTEKGPATKLAQIDLRIPHKRVHFGRRFMQQISQLIPDLYLIHLPETTLRNSPLKIM